VVAGKRSQQAQKIAVDRVVANAPCKLAALIKSYRAVAGFSGHPQRGIDAVIAIGVKIE